MKNDKIKLLIDEFLELEQSEKNRLRREKWYRLPATGRDQWRATPLSDGSWRNGNIPVVIDLQNSIWAKLLGFSLRDYYTDPEVFLENYLRIMIERFKMFDDDVFLSKTISIWGSTVYESSMFGMKYHMSDDNDPWLDHTVLINEPEDLKKIDMPDFYTSGLMPEMIRMYESVSEMAGEEFEVFFPQWIRSPFGICIYLRGFENFLVDMVLDPDFASSLLRFVTDARKAWYDGRAKYLNSKGEPADLFNDEVNCPSLSPDNYRELILPFERELCEYHGGLLYWHSCGDVTPLLEDISSLPTMEMMHVGPWTSVDKAAQIFGEMAPLEICINPQKDVFDANQKEMFDKINSILNSCSKHNINGFYIRASGFGIINSIDFTLGKINEWNKTVRNAAEAFKSDYHKLTDN